MINFDEREYVEPDQVHLFTLDGVEYFVTPPGANLYLELMERMSESSAGVVEAWALRTVIGDDAFEALKAYNGLTEDDLRHLASVVIGLITGDVPVEGTTRPLPRGRRVSTAKKPAAASRPARGRTGSGKTSKRTS